MMWTRRQSVIFIAVVVFVAIAGVLSFRFIYAQEVGPKSCITKADCPADQYCIANRCNVPPPVWNGEGIIGFAPQAASFSITGGGAFGGFSPDPQWQVTTPSIYIGSGAVGTTIKEGKITTDKDLMVKGLIATQKDIIAMGKIATASDLIVSGNLLRSDQLVDVDNDGKLDDPDYYFKASHEIAIGPNGQLEIGTIDASIPGKIINLPTGGGEAATGPWLTAANDSIYYSAGKVGIGTNSPTSSLHLLASSDTMLKIETSSQNPSHGPSLALYHGAGDDWSIYNEGGIFKIVDLSTGQEPLIVKPDSLAVNGDLKASGGGAFGGFDPDSQWQVTTPSIYIGAGEGQAGTTIKEGKIATDSDLIVSGNLLRSDQLDIHKKPDYYFKSTNEIVIDDNGQLWLGTVPASKIMPPLGGGGEAGGAVDECTVSILKSASHTATSNGAGGGYTGVNAKCGSGMHVCTTDEIIKSIRCGVSLPASGSMWVIEGPPGYTAPANDCMGWQSDSASHFGAYWDFGQGQGGVGWMTICSNELPFACCQ